MAYSRSPKTLERLRPLLSKLENDEETEWTVERGAEITFAQMVREALYVASLYPDYYPALAQAQARYKIVRPRDRPGIVQARRKKPLNAVEQSFVGSEGQVSVQLVTEVEGVKEAWERVKETELPRLEFPQLAPSGKEMLDLFEWAKERNLLLFLIPGGGLRVCRSSPELAPLAWDPSDLEGP